MNSVYQLFINFVFIFLGYLPAGRFLDWAMKEPPPYFLIGCIIGILYMGSDYAMSSSVTVCHVYCSSMGFICIC